VKAMRDPFASVRVPITIAGDRDIEKRRVVVSTAQTSVISPHLAARLG